MGFSGSLEDPARKGVKQGEFVSLRRFYLCLTAFKALFRRLNLMARITNGRQIAGVICSAVRLGHHMVNGGCRGVDAEGQTGEAQIPIPNQDDLAQLVPLRTVTPLMPGQPSLIHGPP